MSGAEADADRRHSLERSAVALFGIGALTMALICAGVIAAGWFAGTIDDRFERVFWAGAILAFVMVATFAAAAFPGGADDRSTIRRITLLVRIGLVLFVAAPALCIGALIADYFG